MANLVLLWANPLDSIANWRKISQVIVKGVVHLPETLVNPSPEYLVQQQLNAYNAHDLDAFLEPYAEDVELYEFPGKLIMKGKDAMRKDYEFLTKVPKLYCKVQKRIIQGNMVIDHEEVSGFGPKPLYAVAIYIIEFGKITKVYFKQ